jgi:hypothetical protein
MNRIVVIVLLAATTIIVLLQLWGLSKPPRIKTRTVGCFDKQGKVSALVGLPRGKHFGLYATFECTNAVGAHARVQWDILAQQSGDLFSWTNHYEVFGKGESKVWLTGPENATLFDSFAGRLGGEVQIRAEVLLQNGVTPKSIGIQWREKEPL